MHDLASSRPSKTSLSQLVVCRGIFRPRNLQPTSSALYSRISPRDRRSASHIVREFIYPHFALLSVVNHTPQDFDNRAVDVKEALPADLLVLRSEQLNGIAGQLRIFREAHR